MSERMKVRPALNAEQWEFLEMASGELGVGSGVLFAYIDPDGSELRIGWNDAPTAPMPNGGRAGLAALALHGQPFGFTRADVDLLRSVADATEVDGGFPPGAHSDPLPERDALHRLADRIDALLPPREP